MPSLRTHLQAADSAPATGAATAATAGRKLLQPTAAADDTAAAANATASADTAAYMGCALPAKCGVANAGMVTACGQMLFDANGTHRFTNNEVSVFGRIQG